MARSAGSTISKKDIEDAQKLWTNAIIDIGEAYTSGRDFVDCAKKHIADLYAYSQKRTVLFKPTKCEERQFRLTADGALSYFVGDGSAPAGFPEDKGFAIAPFIDVRFANADLIPESNYAVAMGNYYFMKTNGEVLKVEYTFGYRLINGKLYIEVHHSSLPYVAPPDEK